MHYPNTAPSPFPHDRSSTSDPLCMSGSWVCPFPSRVPPTPAREALPQGHVSTKFGSCSASGGQLRPQSSLLGPPQPCPAFQSCPHWALEAPWYSWGLVGLPSEEPQKWFPQWPLFHRASPIDAFRASTRPRFHPTNGEALCAIRLFSQD